MNPVPEQVTTTTATTRRTVTDAPVSSDGARTVATNNLTWAIAMVLVIAAVAIAFVYVAHSMVHMF